jgi:predicted amidohydrolase YtcJ
MQRDDMKPLALVIAASAMIGWCANSIAQQPPALDRPADLILSGGHVKTSSGWTEAVAIRSGVIVALGNTKSIDALRGPGTQTVALAGATVLPGLHDVHVHPMYAGITERDRCKIAQGSTLQQTLKGVKECADRTKPGEWVIGGQWDAPALGGIPDRRQLDTVTADHPTYLEDTSGHSVWVNSRALALAGITKETHNPTGGIIERDSTGAPTGILRESATELAYQHIPKPSGDALRSALKWSLDEMLSFGITSYTEAAVGFVSGPRAELDVYAQLAKEGLPKQRATLCITWAPGDEATEQGDRATKPVRPAPCLAELREDFSRRRTH